MKMNKKKFLNTEFGAELKGNIKALNYYLNEIKRISQFENLEDYQALDKDIQTLFSKWYVFQLAIKQFYEIEYHFTRTNEYYGICTNDEEDFLFKEPHEN